MSRTYEENNISDAAAATERLHPWAQYGIDCFPKSGKLTPHYDKNTLKLAYLWSSSDLH